MDKPKPNNSIILFMCNDPTSKCVYHNPYSDMDNGCYYYNIHNCSCTSVLANVNRATLYLQKMLDKKISFI